MSHCTGCLRNCEKSKEIGDPSAIAGATSHPREPTQTPGSGNREPGGFCAAGSPPDTSGDEEKPHPVEVTPGRAAGRSAPREASPKGEQMTRGRRATRKHARSLGGITADESKENIPHDCLENLPTPPGGAAWLLPWTCTGPGLPPGSELHRASCPTALVALFQAVLPTEQPWVLKKPSWAQRGFDLGHLKHFLLLSFP